MGTHSVLQCVAVCCSVLQCVAVCCGRYTHLKHFGVLETLCVVVEDAHFRSDGYVAVGVGRVD